MLAKILKDDSLGFTKDSILSPSNPIKIALSVDSGMVADIQVNVRDAEHNDLAMSNNGEPLSTGNIEGGTLEIPFDLPKLNKPRYVIWNTWVIYSGPVVTEPTPFTLMATVSQGDKIYSSKIKAQVAPGDKIVAVKLDGMWIGAPL